MIEQCKGKDLIKVPSSKLNRGLWFGATKYDGHYGQIHKLVDSVVFYTSGGKPFKLPKLEQELITAFGSMQFVLEYEYNMENTGMLGDRTKCGKLTTYRTNTEKGICNSSLEGKEVFRVFDIISYDGELITTPFSNRLKTLTQFSKQFPTRIQLVEFDCLPLEDQIADAKRLVKLGWEGKYIKHPNHTYQLGKRVNEAIKLKYRPTADLLCIGVEPGEGKYLGMIGSLVLKDSASRIVKVGSGLSDSDRVKLPSQFIGQVIEVEYEQILDTYIQPTYIQVREEKSEKEID
jgi:DNA ligase-1